MPHTFRKFSSPPFVSRLPKLYRSFIRIVNSWSFRLCISEEAEKPADLSQRIVFKVKRKEKAEGCAEKDSGGNSSTKPMTKTDSKEKSRRKNQKPAKSSLLSFAEDEDEG